MAKALVSRYFAERTVVAWVMFLASVIPELKAADRPGALLVAAGVRPITTTTSAWQLAWADLDGDGDDEVLYASYSGRLTCQELRTGAVKWTYELEGLPYTLRTCDLDGDGSRPKEQLAACGKGLANFGAVYPYDNITYYSYLGYQEPGYETTQAVTYPVPEIMSLAETAESHRVFHVFVVAHGTDPAVSAETLDGWLRRTPTTCLGIAFSELNVSIYHIPEYAKYKAKFDKFIDEAMLPLIDVAARHRKPSHLIMKENWWVFTPAMKSMSTRLFTPERRKWIVPSVEESATTAPEINFLGWMGLWRSGLVESWATNIIPDHLVINSHFAEWRPNDPHHVLRHLVAYAAAGASHYEIQLHGQVQQLPQRRDRSNPPLNYTPLGLLSQDLFIHMVGKGLLDVPTRATICGISPVAFRFDEPAMAFLDADNHSVSNIPPQIPAESAEGIFSGTEWPWTKTCDTYAPRYLLGVERHGHNFIPQTPLRPTWTHRGPTRS